MTVCRISFCAIHNASTQLTKRHYSQLQENLADIRVHLIAEWRGIDPYLHAVISFGDDIGLSQLKNDEEISRIAAIAIEMTQKLAESNRTTREKLTARKKSIMKLIPCDPSLPSKDSIIKCRSLALG